jgi:glycosyltransferase involved in cell wall biosynthesis
MAWPPIKLSVCVPTYRGERFIEESLVSVASQGLPNLQIIVCDDCSNDRTLQIARGVSARYPEVEWLIRENRSRLGMTENWNACVALARGEFVKMMGQDDILFPDCLAEQVRILTEHPSVSIVASRRVIINSLGSRILHAPSPFEHGRLSGPVAAVRCILSGTNTVGDPVSMTSRTHLVRQAGCFDTSFRYCPDVAMIIRLLALGDFFFDSVSRVGYRVHAAAVGSSSQHIVVAEFSRCLVLLEELLRINFTAQTRSFVAAKSKLLSIVRSRLYTVLNRWPFL